MVVTSTEGTANITSRQDTSTESCTNHVTISPDDEHISSVNCSQRQILGTSSYRIQFLLQLQSQFDGWYLIVKFATDTRNLNMTAVQGGELLMIYKELGPKTVVFLKEAASTSTVNVSFTIQTIEERGPPVPPHKGSKHRNSERRAPPQPPDQSGPKPPPHRRNEQPWWPVEVEVQYTDCTCVQTMPPETSITSMCHGSLLKNPTVKSRPPPPDKKKDDVYNIEIKFHPDPVERGTQKQQDKPAAEENKWVTCRLRFKSQVRVISVDHAVSLQKRPKFSKVYVIVKHVLTRDDPGIILEYAPGRTSNATTTRRDFKSEEVDVECRRCDKSTATPTDRVSVASGDEIIEIVIPYAQIEATSSPDSNDSDKTDPNDIVVIAVTQNVDGQTNKPPTGKTDLNGSSLDIARTGNDKNDGSDDDGYVSGLWIGLVGAVVVVGGVSFILYWYIKRPRPNNSSDTAEKADEEQMEEAAKEEVKPQGKKTHTVV